MDAQDMQDPQDEHLPAPEGLDEPDAPAEPGPVVPPLPRVVGETPLGGTPPRVAPAPVESAPPPADEPAPSVGDLMAATQETARVEPETAELEPDEAEAVPQTSDAAPAPEPEPPAAAPAPAPEVQAAPPASTELPPEPEMAADWDEELSAELAAVLFAGRDAAKAAARPTPADADAARRPVSTLPAPAAAPTPTAVKAQEAAEAEEVAGPIQLTDRAGARTLPLTAESRSAPAPDHALEGQARYRKLAEPLPNNRGQRTVERWDYLAGARPTLGARAVTMVRIEGLDYADGSWTWQFERRFADRGVDRRLVRGNTDGTYVERSDEVSNLDATTGQRRKYREQARLILAAPEPQEKRGGFLSNLLRREEPPEPPTEPVWRDATPGESRQQRQGQAFKRGIFG